MVGQHPFVNLNRIAAFGEKESPGFSASAADRDARGEWNASYEKAPALMPGFLHMTILEPLATNNPRIVPQQSISTVTNIDDIETYIRGVEERHSKSYLSAIDLPANERRKVMHELALMGITAGTLFPGLEGACRQLKERFFELS